MKMQTWVAATALAAMLVISAGAQDIDQALAGIQTYEFGQSRAGLNQVAALVVASLDTPQQQAVADKLVAVLSGDATLECKRFVCRQLAVIGTVQNVEDISEYLVNPELSDMARYALQPIADASVDRALIEALSEASADSEAIMVGLVTSLGARRSEKAIAPLRKLAVAENAAVAEAALCALGRIGGSKSAKALASIKGSAAPALAEAVSHSQLAVADSLLASGQRDRAATIYESLVASGEPDSIRAAAFVGLAKSGGLEGKGEEWRKRMDEDPVLREASAGYLHKVAAEYQDKAEEQTSK